MKVKVEDSNKVVELILKNSLDQIGKIVQKKARLILEMHVKRDTKLADDILYKVDGRDVIIYSNNPVMGYIERGTRPHDIRPKKAGGALAFRADKSGMRKNGSKFNMGDTIVTKRVRHPGTDAKPTLSAALFMSKPEIIQEFKKMFKNPVLVANNSKQNI